MLYDLNIEDDLQRAEMYFAKLVEAEAKIELKRIAENRTIKQNNYVHALFTLFGGEFGYTTDEAKTVIKRALGYVYEKNGKYFLEKTSDMDTVQMTEFIDRFRNYSSHNGLYLPTPDEFRENYFELMKRVEYIEATQKRYGGA